jgi:hypothetical protein
LAAPSLYAGLDGDERDEWVCPPEPEEGVGAEADEDREREVGAEDVLGAFACCSCGLELVPDSFFAWSNSGMSVMLTIASPIPTQLARARSTSETTRLSTFALAVRNRAHRDRPEELCASESDSPLHSGDRNSLDRRGLGLMPAVRLVTASRICSSSACQRKGVLGSASANWRQWRL